MHTDYVPRTARRRGNISPGRLPRPVMANLMGKRRTDEEPDRHGQRSGPRPATSVSSLDRIEPLTVSMRMRAGPATTGLAQGGEGLEPVQPARADVLPRWHSLPMLPVACRTQRSDLANGWPTNDQRHDRRAWRSCHLPGTSLSGWPDLNRRPLRPEAISAEWPWPGHRRTGGPSSSPAQTL